MAEKYEESNLHRVSMNLTPLDVSNTNRLREVFHARSNAQAVSSAISLAVSMADLLRDGGDLIVRDKNGEMQRVVIPGLSK